MKQGLFLLLALLSFFACRQPSKKNTGQTNAIVQDDAVLENLQAENQ
jgi:uncharacterized protein YcfL